MVDAVNITDNQTAIVRMSSIAAGVLALREGLEPVIQITCRDRNRIAIQSDVLGAYALGIRNILCLTGDHQSFGNHPTSKNVYDMDSIQLIGMLAGMRDEKKFACGEEIRNSKKAPVVEPRIFIGGGGEPLRRPLRVPRHPPGQESGRGRGLHPDPVHLRHGAVRGVDATGPGPGPAREGEDPGRASRRSSRWAWPSTCATTWPASPCPTYWLERLEKAADKPAEGIKICVEQIQQLREIEGVAGIHLMAIEWEKMVPRS